VRAVSDKGIIGPWSDSIVVGKLDYRKFSVDTGIGTHCGATDLEVKWVKETEIYYPEYWVGRYIYDDEAMTTPTTSIVQLQAPQGDPNYVLMTDSDGLITSKTDCTP